MIAFPPLINRPHLRSFLAPLLEGAELPFAALEDLSAESAIQLFTYGSSANSLNGNKLYQLKTKCSAIFVAYLSYNRPCESFL